MEISFLLSFLALITAATNLYLGVYVIHLDANAKLNRIFLVLCLSMSIWALANSFGYLAYSNELNFLANKVGALGYCTFAGILLHFSFILSNQKTLIKKWQIFLFYAPGVAFTIKALTGILTVKTFFDTGLGWRGVVVPSDSIWFWAYNIYYISFCLISTFKTMAWGLQSHGKREKKQAKIIVVTAITTLLLCFLNEILLPGLHIYLLPGMSVIFTLIWIFGIWFAIVKYKLMALSSEMVAEEVLERVMDLIILINPEGKIIRVNNRVEEVLGFKSLELVDAPLQNIFYEENDEIFKYIKVKADINFRKEANYRTKDGSPIPVQEFISTIRDRAGELLGFVIISQDMRLTKRLQQEINERKEIEQALRDSNEKLKELDTMKTDFLSTVSHELRTPLTSIVGFTKIIRKKFNTTILAGYETANPRVQKALDQVTENIDIIISEGDRLTNLINDVLDIAKMESGKTEWKMGPVIVEEIITQALAATEGLLATKNIKITKDISPSINQILGDRDRLIQVMINLISNAVKFTEKGSITCKAEDHNQEVWIQVIDTGIGIAEADQLEIFEKFKQVGNTLTDKPKGTGLGLSICKQIVEKHCGRIWVTSELNVGSTFTFTLPAHHGTVKTTPDFDSFISYFRTELTANFLNLESGEKSILVVDDDANIRFLLRQVLENEGYHVTEAKDGMAALNQIKQELVDLIILDVMMPQLNGFDLAAILKNDPETMHIPIIILTVIEDKARGEKIGVDRYLTKPINMDHFVKAVEGLITKNTSKKKVLLVCEDYLIDETLPKLLKEKGFQEVAVCTGKECVEKALQIKPNVIIVDALVSQKYAIKNTLELTKSLENVLVFLLGEERLTSDENQA